jgi:carbamoyltransferase
VKTSTSPRPLQPFPAAEPARRQESRILGISALDKDATAALVIDGKLAKIVMEERLTRVKHQAGFPLRSLRTVMEETGVRASDIDLVTYPFFHWRGEVKAKLEGYLRDLGTLTHRLADPLSCARHQAYYLAWVALTSWRHRQYHRQLRRGLAALRLHEKPLVYLDHHATHAASAYHCSAFDRALVATFDWYGSGLAGSIWLGEAGRLRLLKKLRYPHSLGLFYAAVTRALGFRPSRHEGKIVGLAAYGDPQVLLPTVIRRFVQGDGDFRFLSAMDLDYPRALARRYRPADVAAAHQAALEHLVVRLLTPYLRLHGLTNVALAGGVAANVKLNQRVHEMDGIEGVFIHPAMGDDGTSAGGPLYWLSCNGGLRPRPLEHVYLGNALCQRSVEQEVMASGLPFKLVPDIDRRVGALLADGKVVARVTGNSEYGPRALGNRSILCSAVDHGVNERLNRRLGRTEFMPFAPITLWEHREACYKRLAGGEHAARFMTITFDCTDYMKRASPAAVHVDGTARPQLVEREVSPGLHAILTEYHRRTGIASLINTSYNMHEDPIVATAKDAIDTFKRSGLDYLALGDFLLTQAQGAAAKDGSWLA